MMINQTVSYGGVTPASALTGTPPRELYDHENPGLAAQLGAIESVPDAVETSIRLRMAAKDAINQSIVEDRIAKAHNTRVQQPRPEDAARLTEGAKIDLWREPDSKDDPGWRGPADLVKNYAPDNKAIVVWRGYPMLVPLRHIRPHVGFVWLLTKEPTIYATELASPVASLMDKVALVPGKPIIDGRVYNEAEE